MRIVLSVLALVALVAVADPAAALNCKKYCRSTINACVKQCCNPPDFGVPKRACVIGLRGGAIASCKASGKSACPKRKCPITDC
jgi:hypothetical protein